MLIKYVALLLEYCTINYSHPQCETVTRTYITEPSINVQLTTVLGIVIMTSIILIPKGIKGIEVYYKVLRY